MNYFQLLSSVMRYLVLLVLTVVLSSCSRLSVPIQSPDKPVETTPKKSLTEVEKPSIQHKKEIKVAKPEPEPELEPVYEISFTPNEMDHIKMTSYNPFVGDDTKLTLDLEQQVSDFCYPYPGKLISPYGMRGRRMHSGCDIKGVPGEKIYAAFSGVVRLSKPYSGYGNVVVIRHANGLETVYSHNTKNLVKVGQSVAAGQPIATIGRTGSATTEHLHFEVRVMGQTINPQLLLDTDNHTIQKGILTLERQGSTIKASNKISGVTPTTPVTQPARPSNDQIKAHAATASTATTTTSEEIYHTIKSGDTLYGLALKYKTSVAKICKLNNMTEKTILKLGRKLRIL